MRQVLIFISAAILANHYMLAQGRYERESVIALSSPTLTQSDIVYLKNGTIIKGVILEMIPDSIVSIKTEDGKISVLDMKDIARMLEQPPVDLSFRCPNTMIRQAPVPG